MCMKTVVITCASGIATSTLVVNKVKKLCGDNQIDCRIIQCSYQELAKFADSCDVIVSTLKMENTFNKPMYFAVSYITGINEAKLNEQLLEELRK
ncbi:PTS sugar transporter subunit IIB [Enterocloster asparagiformis]